MSEIEKIYENAGVSKEPAIIPSSGEVIYWKNYPPFTAEKQIELIRWFMHSRHFSPLRFNAQWIVDDIASYINFLWQVLTEEEKQQIKEILNG